MTQREIIEQLKKLAPAQRLAIVEATLRSIREELVPAQEPVAKSERGRKLAAAAKALLPDYAQGGDLTSFTALDSEDFHASK
jgi:hypothetical protein